MTESAIALQGPTGAEEQAVLENKAVDLTLGGVIYPYQQPSHRECRRLSIQILRMWRGVGVSVDDPGAAAESLTGLSAESALEMVDRAQDFLYSLLDLMPEERQRLDNDAQDVEILEAFQKVTELFLRPSRGLAEATKKATDERKETARD